MLKIFTNNFWYDLMLRLTYFQTLSKGLFNKDEIRNIKIEFENLISKNKFLLGDVYSEFHLSWCSAILATYHACLNKGIEKKEAVEFCEQAIFENMQAGAISRRIEIMLDKSKDPFRAIVNSSKYQEEKFFGNTFVITREVDDENRYEALIHKCFYNDYFRGNGAPELMRIACRWDFISWAKGIIPEKHGIKFTREVTLGLDGKECPFYFERIKK